MSLSPRGTSSDCTFTPQLNSRLDLCFWCTLRMCRIMQKVNVKCTMRKQSTSHLAMLCPLAENQGHSNTLQGRLGVQIKHEELSKWLGRTHFLAGQVHRGVTQAASERSKQPEQTRNIKNARIQWEHHHNTDVHSHAEINATSWCPLCSSEHQMIFLQWIWFWDYSKNWIEIPAGAVKWL